MKSLTLLLTTLFLFSSPVVWSEEVEFGDLVYRDGLWYEKFSEEPFSGTVCCKYRGKIKKGKREGKWTRWYPNGQLFWRYNHKNGKRVGLFESYYENGQLKVRTNYKNGKEEGLEEWYYENGQLSRRGNFKNGKKVGKWEFYNEDGNSISCREYDPFNVLRCEKLE